MPQRKTKAKPKRHDYRAEGGRFGKRPQTMKIPPVQQQAWLAGATPGWWISDHLEELRHFVSWIYVGVHKIAQQWAQAKVCVYDKSQEDPYEKALRELRRPDIVTLAKACRAWRMKSDTPDMEAEQETPLPEHAAMDLLERPNPFTSGRVFRYQVACQIRLTGGVNIWEVPNQFGEPQHLWVIPRGWSRPMAPTGQYPNGWFQITPIFNTFTQGIVSPSLSTYQVPYEQMIQLGWPSPLFPGEFTSPLSACSQIIDIMEQTDTATWAGMLNAVKPSLVFNIDPRNSTGNVAEDAMNRFVTELENFKSGPNNAGKILAMLGLTVQQMMNGPAELDYVNGRMQNRESVLAIQGVAPTVAGITEAANYSAAAVAAKTTIEFSVEPDLAMYSDALTHRWQPIWGDDFRIEHSAKTLDDPTLTLQKAANVATAYTTGVVSANEYRAVLDLPPLPDPIADIPQVLLQPMMAPMGSPEPGMPGAEEDDPYANFEYDMGDGLPDDEDTGIANPLMAAAPGNNKAFNLPRFVGKNVPYDESKHPRDDHGRWATASGKQFVFNPGHTRHKKVAEHVRRAIDRLSSAGVKLPNMVQVDKLASHNVHGWHDDNDAEIGSRVTINPNSWFWKDPEGNAKKLHEKGVFSTDDPTHIVTHEIAHSLHKQNYPRAGYDLMLTNYRFEGVEQKTAVEKEVGKYATTNGHEFVAEVFAGMVGGKTYSPLVMRAYKELHGPEVPQKEKAYDWRRNGTLNGTH